MSLVILHQDNHLLVVDKPPGLLVQGDKSGEPSLLDLAKAYRKNTEQKLGNVFVGLVHRLDRPVGGVVVLAKTSKAAARLSEQFRERTVEKIYLAVSSAPPAFQSDRPTVTWTDRLLKNLDRHKVVVVPPSRGHEAGVRDAVTEARLLEKAGKMLLWRLVPRTGRAHQLRAQAAARGLPLIGDRRYGSSIDFGGAIGLHAFRLTIVHPTVGISMTFRSRPPTSWNKLPFNWPAVLAEE